MKFSFPLLFKYILLLSVFLIHNRFWRRAQLIFSDFVSANTHYDWSGDRVIVKSQIANQKFRATRLIQSVDRILPEYTKFLKEQETCIGNFKRLLSNKEKVPYQVRASVQITRVDLRRVISKNHNAISI